MSTELGDESLKTRTSLVVFAAAKKAVEILHEEEKVNMAYYSVLAVTPTTEEWIPNYLGPANRLVTQYGGKYLARTANHERLEGEGESAALRIVIEWPSKEAALGFMNDAEYKPHLAARTAGSISHHFLIEAKDDLA